MPWKQSVKQELGCRWIENDLGAQALETVKQRSHSLNTRAVIPQDLLRNCERSPQLSAPRRMTWSLHPSWSRLLWACRFPGYATAGLKAWWCEFALRHCHGHQESSDDKTPAELRLSRCGEVWGNTSTFSFLAMCLRSCPSLFRSLCYSQELYNMSSHVQG